MNIFNMYDSSTRKKRIHVLKFFLQCYVILFSIIAHVKGRIGSDPESDNNNNNVEENNIIRPLSINAESRHPVLIVKSSADYTKLQLVDEGIELLKKIDKPIAVVVVIGPYRSGKSFLLNQLLGVGCKEGFGVGHQRHAQTKGIWMWSEPQIANGHAIMYIDTEGFESTGKAAVYDDRIFALSTLFSSLLIYNLPETVREADISKLSFAVELAQEFSGRGQHSQFQMPHLMWLIQRDFLEGQSVTNMVEAALKPVANPDNDPSLTHLNTIRKELTSTHTNHSAFGLIQPHLQRTKLCELKDSELEPKYLKQRERLRIKVKQLAAAKLVNNQLMHGGELVEFLKRMLKAVNTGKIPTVGSITDTFNKRILDSCVEHFKKDMKKLKLPKETSTLEKIYKHRYTEAVHCYHQDAFGKSKKLHQNMLEMLEKKSKEAYQYRVQANVYQSGILCERLYLNCQAESEQMLKMKLPSRVRFETNMENCNATYVKTCVGPSKTKYFRMLTKLQGKEKQHFLKNYNDRLMNGLSLISFGCLMGGRFIFNSPLFELFGWAGFALLELYPKMFLFSSTSMYEQKWWITMSKVWEIAVFNEFYDLNNILPQFYGMLIFIVLWQKSKYFRACLKYIFGCCCPKCCCKYCKSNKKAKVDRHIV